MKLPHRGFGDDTAASDTHSIRSGRSFTSTISNTIRHPDMHEPGLNVSVVETLSVHFTPTTEVEKAVHIGEVALSYNAASDSSTPETETIKLLGFQGLEKVAPNPLFINPTSQDGEYDVDVKHILSRTSVSFKYQVHLTNAAISAPLTLVPAFKSSPDNHTTLIMLSYVLNPAFVATSVTNSDNQSSSTSSESQPSELSLANVIIILHIDPSAGRVARCQLSAGGHYMRDRNLIYWRLGDVKLSRSAPANVLRAKLITDLGGEAVIPANAEARWEVVGEQGVGSGVGLVRREERIAEDEAEEVDPFADEAKNEGAESDGDGEKGKDGDTEQGKKKEKEKVAWVDVHRVMRVRSGSYVAAAVVHGAP